MGRLAHAVAPFALALLAAGCGEPLVVLGDAPGLMRIVIGVGDSIGTRVDSLAVRTRLRQPLAVAFSTSSSLLYVADRGALRQAGGVTTQVARIFAVDSRGRTTLLLDAGGCTQGICVDEVSALVYAPNNTLVIADGVGNRVLRYAPGGQLTVLAGTGTAGTSPDGARANQSPVLQPRGVASAADGTIYFSEAGAHRVRSIGSDGLLRTVAGTGVRGRTGDGGPAATAQLNEPAGLLLDDGALYVAEYGGSSVRVIDVAGIIRTVAGTGVAGFEGDGGPATAARLNRPYALAIAGAGRTLFISDQGNDRVRAVDLLGGVIRTFAGTGSRAFTGNRRAAGETSLFSPAGLDAAAGFLFITDPGHSVVWRTSTTFD